MNTEMNEFFVSPYITDLLKWRNIFTIQLFSAKQNSTKTSKVLGNGRTTISERSSCPDQDMKIIQKPKPTYPDMFPDIFELPAVERNFEKRSVVDSAAFSLEEEFNKFDENKVDKFLKSIMTEDGRIMQHDSEYEIHLGYHKLCKYLRQEEFIHEEGYTGPSSWNI